jgi:multisubunit Na+/H+ antiporter MnhB subunit
MIRSTSPVAELGVRAATPPALMVGMFLFFAGHNRPGGGFAAGLIIGAVVALRWMVGLRTTVVPSQLMAAGIVIVAGVALAPVLFGSVVLDQAVWSTSLPVLGKVKAGSAAIFDIGVSAIVVGLVIAVIDGLSPATTSAPEGQSS